MGENERLKQGKNLGGAMPKFRKNQKISQKLALRMDILDRDSVNLSLRRLA
jgi:hypothetical protein